MKFWKKSVLLLILVSLAAHGWAQRKSQDVVVGSDGVMRWGHNREEVKGFGVNYTAMFAHAYRTAKRLNIPLEQAIENDIYHFSRLGFDLFRIHVWDTEISDTTGNLLDNEHLRLFDFALAKMKERGINFVITPIAFWGNGWPEPDEPTPGFARKYGKDACLTHPEAIRAQERYLAQFVNHVNRYTGVAYKDEPSIIAFEISNEPHHRGTPAEVTSFIKKMVKAIAGTGCRKPVFYNISHSIHLVDAYYAAGIQGGTFQWYPTGLGAGHELQGNLLPNVDDYRIPFAQNPRFRKSAKLVYEFDAADVGRSYIYPAMARSFRTAGIQIATHFSYDPTYMADVNTEYGTHYMNLTYAPQKALSLMIASEVFHRIPMYQDFGSYPRNTSFGDFRVNYDEDLAEMVTENKFIYTNHTRTSPPAVASLTTIAGYGNSPVVAYDGAGAYFLDRIEDGVWRLEVMPDAIWLHDPFERTSPKKKVAAIQWAEHNMFINLPGLTSRFAVKGINDGNDYHTMAEGGRFTVKPGTYFVVKEGVTPKAQPADRWRNITLNEFFAPAASLKAPFVAHKPQPTSPGKDYTVRARVAAPGPVESVQVYAWVQGYQPEVLGMKAVGANVFEATLPGDKMTAGVVRYHVIVNTSGKSYSFPSGLQTHPRDWDFYDRNPYQTSVIADDEPILLFDAATDASRLARQWTRNSGLKPSFDPGTAELEVRVEKLFVRDPENPNGEAIHDYSMRYYVGDNMGNRRDALVEKRKIVFRGRSLTGGVIPVQVAVITRDAKTFGATIEIDTTTKDVEINIEDMAPAKMVTLPRPYPTFLPYYFEGGESGPLDVNDIEVIQISIGPGLPAGQQEKPQGISIGRIVLE